MSMTQPHRAAIQLRPAVTLVEVIFSIGVILIGLLGLMSILPLAGRRAQDAVNMSVGAALGDAALNELKSRRWISDRKLVDFETGQWIEYDASGPALVRTDGTTPTALPGICIDSLYVAEQGGTFHVNDGYTDVWFPYYSDLYDPLLNPTWTPSWPASQARLRRVGLRYIVDPTNPDPVSGGVPYSTVSLEAARLLAERPGDLAVTRPDDRAESARMLGLETDSSLEYGRRPPSGEYSWIATITPLPGGIYASVAVVVMRNRDRTRDYPLFPVDETDPKRNGIAERIAYVSEAYGFRGGAGGTVHLTASSNVLSTLLVGDWVMLSRPTATPPLSMHRWFRVAAIDGDPEVMVPSSNTVLEPAGAELPDSSPVDRTTTTVWRHKVLLDGPDWSPGLDTPTDFSDDTIATIVPDVVSVTERVIRLEDL